MQIRIGRCAKVFPLHTVLIFYLHICSVILCFCCADTQIQIQNDHFYLRKQINLSAAQINLCLDAKNWDRRRYAFARNIALELCTK